MGESCKGAKNVFGELGHGMQGQRIRKVDSLNEVLLGK